MTKLRIGLIGAGRVAQAHAKACAILGDRVELVAVCDSDEARASATAARHRVTYATTDYHGLLGQEFVDAVIIAVPHELHATTCIDAARAGKHILVEKPMAPSLDDATVMAKSARESGVTLMVGQSRRFTDAARTLVRRKGEIGEIIRIVVNFLVYFPSAPTAWWGAPSGDLILELQGCHYLDMATWLMGSLPERVFATTRRVSPGHGGTDEGDVMLLYPGGITANIHLSLNTQPEAHEMLVVGDRGSMRIREWGTGAPFEFGLALEVNGDRIMEGTQVPSNYTLQLEEFADAIAAGRQPLASGEEVLATVRLTEAAVRSASMGEWVSL